MAITSHLLIKRVYVIVLLNFISFLPNYCFCMRSTLENYQNYSTVLGSFSSSAVATWYGDAHGAGSVGGACGYRQSVEQPPFYAMISAGNANLFQGGLGCGACYQVKCTENAACSGNPVTVTITDECNCDTQNVHFDLSGTAFGAMAKPGQADALRAAGTFKIQYQRVPCNYPRKKVVFEVDSGSNPYYFACVVKYVNGDGDLSYVEVQTKNSNKWLPMAHLSGAVWRINFPSGFQAPLSIRMTTLKSKKTIVASNVIPAGWQPGKSYESLVNFL